MVHPHFDPKDPAYRPPLDPTAPFPSEGEVGHPNLKELLFANLSESDVVIDVGCGPGPFEYSKFPAKFIGLDMFPPESEEGMKSGQDEFKLGEITDRFPFPDESVEAVVMGFVLEHVTNPKDMLAEANRVLKPGGWCYVAIPNHRSLEDRLFRLATSIVGSTRGPHIQRFTFDNFRDLAERETALRLVSWHLLPSSHMWMNHPKLRLMRKPFLRFLRLLKAIGIDTFPEANYQFLLKKGG